MMTWLIASMKAGITMLVDGVSTRGTEIRDTFSLRGFTKAYNRISEVPHQLTRR